MSVKTQQHACGTDAVTSTYLVRISKWQYKVFSILLCILKISSYTQISGFYSRIVCNKSVLLSMNPALHLSSLIYLENSFLHGHTVSINRLCLHIRTLTHMIWITIMCLERYAWLTLCYFIRFWPVNLGCSWSIVLAVTEMSLLHAVSIKFAFFSSVAEISPLTGAFLQLDKSGPKLFKSLFAVTPSLRHQQYRKHSVFCHFTLSLRTANHV